MLQKLREDEPQAEKPLAELDNLGRTDWVRRGPLLSGHRRFCAWRARGSPTGANGIFISSGPRPDCGSSSCGNSAMG